jgi:hypothetical protein
MSGQLAKFGLMASLASIAGSLYLYFVGNDEMLGIFVGLWAPTLIQVTKTLTNKNLKSPRDSSALLQQLPKGDLKARMRWQISSTKIRKE